MKGSCNTGLSRVQANHAKLNIYTWKAALRNDSGCTFFAAKRRRSQPGCQTARQAGTPKTVMKEFDLLDLDMAEVVAAKVVHARKVAKKKAQAALHSDIDATNTFLEQLKEERRNLLLLSDAPDALYQASSEAPEDKVAERGTCQGIKAQVEGLASEAVEVWSHTVHQIQTLERPDPWTAEVVSMLVERQGEVVVVVPEGEVPRGSLVVGYFQRHLSTLKSSPHDQVCVVGGFNGWSCCFFDIPLLACLAAPHHPAPKTETESDWAEDFSFLDRNAPETSPQSQTQDLAEDFSFYNQKESVLTEDFSWHYFLLEVPEFVYEMNFVFTDGHGMFDNNNYKNYVVRMKDPPTKEEAHAHMKAKEAKERQRERHRGLWRRQKAWHTEPTQVQAGQTVKLFYQQGPAHLQQASQILLHLGVDQWATALHAGSEMRHSGPNDEGRWEIHIHVPNDVKKLDFVFEDGFGNYDNNDGQDYHCSVL